MSGQKPEREWEHLSLVLTEGVYACYSLYHVKPGTTGTLTALSGSQGTVQVTIAGQEAKTLTITEGESESFPVPQGEKVTVRIEGMTGRVQLKTVAFCV